jgi:hypothetical protein
MSLVLFIGVLVAPVFIMQGIAAPVIIDGDSFGNWEDIFEDTKGIDAWDNFQLRNEAIELINIPIFSDNFTGTNGDPPDPSKWDIIDDGYTLEIENNQLKASSIPNHGSWYAEMVRTNMSFSMNHTLTWRQQLHLVSGTGMYYTLRVWDGSLNPLFGLNQNSASPNQYNLYNYATTSDTLVSTSVSGWHDYKIIFTNGFVEFFFDGVKKFEYNYGVSSIKYQFGNHQLNEPGTIYTDDVLISRYPMRGNLTSTEIILPEGQTWESLVIDKTEYGAENNINVTVLDGSTYLPIPGFENLTATNVDISTINYTMYPTLRLRAHFFGDTLKTPVLEGWRVTWLDTTKDKGEKEDEFGIVEMLLIVILIMLIINILVSIIGGRKRGSEEPPVPPNYGYPQEPYPPSQPPAPYDDAPPPVEDEQMGSNTETEKLSQAPPPPQEY